MTCILHGLGSALGILQGGQSLYFLSSVHVGTWHFGTLISACIPEPLYQGQNTEQTISENGQVQYLGKCFEYLMRHKR